MVHKGDLFQNKLKNAGINITL